MLKWRETDQEEDIHKFNETEEKMARVKRVVTFRVHVSIMR